MAYTDEQKELMNHDDTEKQVTLAFGSPIGSIGNDKIYMESMSLEESLYDEDEIVLGKCNSALFTVKVADFSENIKGRNMSVSVALTNETLDASMTYKVGEFIVQSVERTSDRRWKIIRAVDYMSKFDKDITNWYNNTLFPNDSMTRTVNTIVQMLCTYIGVSYNSNTTLINGTITVSKGIEAEVLTGREFLEMICEFNNVYGHFDENGVLQFIKLQNAQTPESISTYKSCDYEDYSVLPITMVTVLDEEGKFRVGAAVGGPGIVTNNIYIINNYLMFGVSDADANTAITNIVNETRYISFRPNTTVANGLMYMGLGTQYEVETSNDTVQSFVLKRSINGIQAMQSTLESHGTSNPIKDILSEDDKANISRTSSQKTAKKTIISDTLHYLATSLSSGVTRDTAGWTTTVQDMSSSNPYLWTYHTYTKGDNSTVDTDPVITGRYGQDGTDGQDGADGVGIVSVVPIYYLTSTSTVPTLPSSEVVSTATTANTWTLVMPEVTSSNKYLFQSEQIKYTTNTFSWSSAVLNNAIMSLDDRVTTAESKVTDNAIINTVQSNLKIGGRNLLTDTDTRELEPYTGATLTFTPNQTVTEWGATDAIRVTGTPKSNYVVFATLTDNETSLASTSYVFSIYIKNVGAETITINPNGLGSGAVPVAQGESKRLIINATGNGSAALQFTFRTTTAGANVDFYYWHPQIEEGNIASDWSLNPDDTARQTYAEQLDDQFHWIVQNGSTSSSVTYTANALSAMANQIDLTGKVTFNSLTDGAKAIVAAYGTSDTAANVGTKVVACANFSLVTGAKIAVNFTNENTASPLFLNVNSTGAKQVFASEGAVYSGTRHNWTAANTIVEFVYDGTYWQVVDSAGTSIMNNIYTSGTTTIDGGKITADSVTAREIDVDTVLADEIFSKNITATGTVTGGTFITQNRYDADTTYDTVIKNASFVITAGNYLKARLYGTGANGNTLSSIGQLQLFSGDVDLNGNRTYGSRYTYLNPTSLVVGLGLTDNISSESNILTRVIKCQDGQYLRSKLDVSNESAAVNSEGTLNLFSGNVDSVGTRDVGSRWTRLSPTTLELGVDANGNISTDAIVYTHDVVTNKTWTDNIDIGAGGKIYIQDTSGGSYYGGSGNTCILTSNTNGTSFKSLYDLAVTEGNGTFTNTTISSGTWTKIGTFTIPKGKYLIITQADISTASGGTYTDGVVGLGINTGTSTKSSYARFDSKVNCNAGSVYLQNIRVGSYSASRDINLWVHSTMANAISVDAGFMYLELPG